MYISSINSDVIQTAYRITGEAMQCILSCKIDREDYNTNVDTIFKKSNEEWTQFAVEHRADKNMVTTLIFVNLVKGKINEISISDIVSGKGLNCSQKTADLASVDVASEYFRYTIIPKIESGENIMAVVDEYIDYIKALQII